MPTSIFGLGDRTTQIETSRGCPFNCCFCCTTHFWGRKWRSRDPDEVVKEIRSDKRHKSSLIDKLNLDLVDKTGKDKIEKYNAETEELNEKQKIMVSSIKQVKERIQTLKKELEALEKKYKNIKFSTIIIIILFIN